MKLKFAFVVMGFLIWGLLMAFRQDYSPYSWCQKSVSCLFVLSGLCWRKAPILYVSVFQGVYCSSPQGQKTPTLWSDWRVECAMPSLCLLPVTPWKPYLTPLRNNIVQVYYFYLLLFPLGKPVMSDALPSGFTGLLLIPLSYLLIFLPSPLSLSVLPFFCLVHLLFLSCYSCAFFVKIHSTFSIKR